MHFARRLFFLTVAMAAAGSGSNAFAQNHTLLNVSYDPTRELYREFNEAFAAHYRELTGRSVTINMSLLRLPGACSH
jgi:sulfate/thiosulfate transport system substrate-binding protein